MEAIKDPVAALFIIPVAVIIYYLAKELFKDTGHKDFKMKYDKE